MGFGFSRRNFLRIAGAAGTLNWSRLKSFGSTARGATPDPVPAEKPLNRLFSPGLKGGDWNTFQAHGYAQDASGICYRTKAAGYFSCYVDKPFPCSGMPLGGIDTGALYLEPSGVLGYTSIFNHLTPIGGPLNVPYMGLASGGRSWVFGTAQTKNYAGNNRPSMGVKVLGSMQESEYWGHYPIADIEYKSDAPVQVGVRCWSPFIPGDAKASNTPGAVFETHLRNTSSSVQKGSLLFNFPGFADHRSADTSIGWPDLPMKPVMPAPQVSRRNVPAGL